MAPCQHIDQRHHPQVYHDGLSLVGADERARIQRFFHRADSHRCLIGRVLPRVLLRERGFSAESIAFGATAAKKPYFTTPGIVPPLGYNVSHDNDLVAMAFAPDEHGTPAYRVGVDVMKVRPPRRESFASFVHTVGDTLTDLEKRLLLSGDVSQEEALQRFYLLWTTKEAYTKALGLGLGFDFRRVEYDIPANSVTVDGAVVDDYEFSMFRLLLNGDTYLGVGVRFVGVGNGGVTALQDQQIMTLDAVVFMDRALRELL
ncbi:4'-phosphopantetheinyl transferase [Auriscalpium vulgare]|uniref:4'-phosphopantetheinyl transferase n=1 Tax=Auriscalpium vulgare TaxID=40419 RepID=A0ACB8S0F8_9AGAM|nr:4'-phosphopantetheinyl transferase [Auriscalpium vulgare]